MSDFEDAQNKLKREIMILTFKMLLIEGLIAFASALFLLGIITGFTLMENAETIKHEIAYILLIGFSISLYHRFIEAYYKMIKEVDG